MNSKPLSQLLEEDFVQCRDMDASLAERLQAFADAVRRFGKYTDPTCRFVLSGGADCP